jgi:myosin heavy chain 6/7
LLEKSRVIRQAPGERCYHIFYQLHSEFVPGLKDKLQLDKPLKDYWFVAQAELQIDGVDDKEEHGMTDEAFDILKFSPEEKFNCYRLVSAMMHMGNMKFKQRPREEQAEPDGTDGSLLINPELGTWGGYRGTECTSQRVGAGDMMRVR